MEAAYEVMAVAPEDTASTTNPSPTEMPSSSNGDAESKEVEHVNYDATSAEETADAPLSTPSKKATKYERMKNAFSKKTPKKKKKHKKDRLRGRKSYFWGQEESTPDPPSLSEETAAEKLKQKSTRKRKREREKKKKEKFDKMFLEASSETILSIGSGDQVARSVQQLEDIVDSRSTRQTDLGKSDSGEAKDAKTSKDSGTSPQLQGSAELGDEEMKEMEADIRDDPEAVVVEESGSRRLVKDASLRPFGRGKIIGMPGWLFISLVVGLVLGTALGTALAAVLSR